MRNDYRTKRNHERSGFVLLLLLLVAVLIAVYLYCTVWKGSRPVVCDGVELKNPPWRQWRAYQEYLSKEEEEVLSPQQPKITEHLGLSATLFKEQDKRGTIILEFFSDYTIEGDWLGSYYSDPNKTKELDLKGEFKGYIIPDATRAGLDISNDPNKIYFLSYGTFVGVEYDNKGDRPRKVMGIIYVSGWLGPDYTIHQGQVVTTYNEKRFKLFTFSGKAEKLKSGTLRSLMKALQKK